MKIRDRSTLNLFSDPHGDIGRAPLRVWLDPNEPIGDNFAGGGGARLGIEQAFEKLGLPPPPLSVAVNHWPEALAMYQANHPSCRVFCEDIVKIDPAAARGSGGARRDRDDRIRARTTESSMNTPEQQEVVDRIKAQHREVKRRGVRVRQTKVNELAKKAAQYARKYKVSLSRAGSVFGISRPAVSKAWAALYPKLTPKVRAKNRG